MLFWERSAIVQSQWAGRTGAGSVEGQTMGRRWLTLYNTLSAKVENTLLGKVENHEKLILSNCLLK